MTDCLSKIIFASLFRLTDRMEQFSYCVYVFCLLGSSKCSNYKRVTLCHLVRLFQVMAVLWGKESRGTNQHPFMSAAAHHAVCVLCEPLQREQRVVRLNDHVTHLVLVWEYRVRLHQLLWVPGDQRVYITLSENIRSFSYRSCSK